MNPGRIYSKNCVKIDKTKILMTNGGLMQDKSIAECSPSYTFDLH